MKCEGCDQVSGRMSIFNIIFCATRFCVSLFRPIVPLQSNWRAPWSALARVTALPPSLSLQHNTPHIIIQKKGQQRGLLWHLGHGLWHRIWGQPQSGPTAEEHEKCYGGWVGKASRVKYAALKGCVWAQQWKHKSHFNSVIYLQVIQML